MTHKNDSIHQKLQHTTKVRHCASREITHRWATYYEGDEGGHLTDQQRYLPFLQVSVNIWWWRALFWALCWHYWVFLGVPVYSGLGTHCRPQWILWRRQGVEPVFSQEKRRRGGDDDGVRVLWPAMLPPHSQCESVRVREWESERASRERNVEVGSSAAEWLGSPSSACAPR